MLKKYLPYIFLVAAALLLFLIKKNQRGPAPVKPSSEQTDTHITVPAVLPAEDKTDREEGLNRNISNLVFSKHARCRMDCRKIDESEVREILLKGTVNQKKIQRDKRGITWPVEGVTHDNQRVRIVFAPRGDEALVVVTVIDLDTDWSCDCK
ncbi:MAG TPA: DUF4258 domain-containing protein [Ferruginibacter sp.]|nr:DUF4258 domain-containing protein [Ferruginibacter sp.]